MAKENEKVVEKKNRYELVEVPTQTAIMVRDNDNESILQDKEVLAEILNNQHKLMKELLK